MDGIFHVCRAFEDPDVIHVEDRINPVEDLEIIHNELRAKDMARTNAEMEVCGVLAPPSLPSPPYLPLPRASVGPNAASLLLDRPPFQLVDPEEDDSKGP